MKSESLKILTSIIITIILVSTLLSQIQIADVITTLMSIDPVYLAMGFGLYLLSHFLRAMRFYILFKGDIKLRDLFNIVCIHNMMNNILPARTGELSYIYLLKKYHNKNIGEGVATLLVARVFDIISISLLFGVSALMIKDLPDMVAKVVFFIVFFLALVILFLITLLYSGNSFLNLVRIFFKRFGIEKKWIVDYILRKGVETVESFEELKSITDIYRAFIYSILIFSLGYLTVYTILCGMDIHLPIQKVVLGGSLVLLTSVLPIHGIGGFGTIEGVWAIVFVSLGLSLETAIISGFSYHIIIWIYFLIAGGYGIVMAYSNDSPQR